MIDTVLQAELPSSEENPSLREKILKNNMHREDHLSSPNNRCYVKGQCQCSHPNPLQRTTALDESGRVIYRCRIEKDRMVVSYMPFPMELMDRHVNVDVTFTVSIIMYLYKYLFNGPDTTQDTIDDPGKDDVDEIKDFINACYVSASEAAWRIFNFEIMRKFPTISSLPVHLPGQNFHQMPQRNGTASTASKLLRSFARPNIPLFTALKYTGCYAKYIHNPFP